MDNFITVLFKERKASKRVVEAITKSANVPLQESKKTQPLVFEHEGGIAIRVQLANSLTEAQSDITVDRLAKSLFEMGYDDFDIETSIPDTEINEAAPRRPELDAIVQKYAKQGMTLSDLAAMVAEAEGTKIQDFDPKAQGDDRNILQRAGDVVRDVGNSVSRRLDSAQYRKRYVLAYASWSLGLPGLYDPNGTKFYYIEDGTGEVKAASGGSLKQALAVAQAGLLPPPVMEKINKNFKRYDNVQPGDTQGRNIKQRIDQIRAAFAQSQNTPTAPGDNDAQPGTGTGGANDGSDGAQDAPVPTPPAGGDSTPGDAMADYRASLQGKTSAELRAEAMRLNGQLIDLLDVIGESTLQQEIYFQLNEGASEDARIAEIVQKLEIIKGMQGSDGKPALERMNLDLVNTQIERAQFAVQRHRQASASTPGTGASTDTGTATDGEDSDTADNPKGEGVAFEYKGKTYYADPTRRTLAGKNFYRVYENQELTPTPRWPKKATEGHPSGIYALIEEAILGSEGMEMGYDPALPALGAFANSGKKGLANDPDEKEAIDELQAFLRIPRTGIYDEATVAAVKAYQEANGLTVDGDAGPQTIGHMQGKVEDEGEDSVAQDKWENAQLVDPNAQPTNEIAFDVGDGVIATVPAEYVEGGKVMVRWGESTPVEEELPERIVDLIEQEMDRRADAEEPGEEPGDEEGDDGDEAVPTPPEPEEGGDDGEEETPPEDGEDGSEEVPTPPEPEEDGEDGEEETPPEDGEEETPDDSGDDLEGNNQGDGGEDDGEEDDGGEDGSEETPGGGESKTYTAEQFGDAMADAAEMTPGDKIEIDGLELEIVEGEDGEPVIGYPTSPEDRAKFDELVEQYLNSLGA